MSCSLVFFTIEAQHRFSNHTDLLLLRKTQERGQGILQGFSKTIITRGEISPFLECSEKGWDRWRRKTESHIDIARSIKNMLAFLKMGRAHKSEPTVQITSPMRSVKSRCDLQRPWWDVISRDHGVCLSRGSPWSSSNLCPPKWSRAENNVKEAFKTHHWDYSTF